MCRRTLFALALTIGPLLAQQYTQVADKRAASWFDKGESMTRKINRLHALQKRDMDMYEKAFTKALPGVSNRTDIGFAILKFNVLFDAKDQVLAGAVIKYTRRLEQLPANVVDEWHTLTGASSPYDAFSLTAEDALFPREKFSEQAFKSLVSRLSK